MKILMVYHKQKGPMRKTIEDSIFSFKKYSPHYVQMYYYSYSPEYSINKIIKRMKFDVVIFHSIFMCLRWTSTRQEWQQIIDDFSECWRNSVKGVFIQDEQYLTNRSYQFINSLKIDIIFTCANKKAVKILYPIDTVKVKAIYKVLTGYVDEKTLKQIKQIKKNEKIKRKIDIGYRADITPFALGFQGRLKSLIPEVFNKELKQYPQIKADIKNTYGEKNVFWGLDWYRFMLGCRTVLGSMGGASIQDPNGEIRDRVNKYMNKNRNCSYNEVKLNILDIYGKEINYSSISPRSLEAAMTKTCQVLIEGDYAGILKPNIHYIEIKKDFSNLSDVLQKIQNKRLCKSIAQRTYHDIVISGKYTYRRHVEYICYLLKKQVPNNIKTNIFKQNFLEIILNISNFIIDNEYI